MSYGLWADDKPEPVKDSSGKTHWSDPVDQINFRSELMFVHQEIVNIQATYGAINLKDIAHSLNYSSLKGSFDAIIEADPRHFDSRPLNTKKLLRIAERLRLIDPAYWLEIIRAGHCIMDQKVTNALKQEYIA